MPVGTVYFVGAGPGDIGLITVKGLERLKQADVVLYDRLVNPELLTYTRPDCEKIYCGKLPKHHILRQEQINAALVAKAKEGKTVVRLKGGDPGVFGRVGEEAAELAKHGIPFEIVPGITSGIAAPLYAGIPVTHREYGHSFALVSAHGQATEPQVDWSALAKMDTIAFYMGVANLPLICDQLLAHGKRSDTPVILIRWGTMGRQQTLEGTLETIAKKAEEAAFSNPAITLVGDVITLRKTTNWFEKKRLFGKQILLASDGTETEFAQTLRAEGADVFEFPKWKLVKKEIERYVFAKLPSYEQIIFTSSESVRFFFAALRSEKIDVRTIKAELCARTPRAKRALEERGFHVSDEHQPLGKTLVVGEKGLGSKEWCLTHEVKQEETSQLLWERMKEEADVRTVIFPTVASVHCLLAMGDTEWLSQRTILCFDNETKETAQTYGLFARCIEKETLIDYLARER